MRYDVDTAALRADATTMGEVHGRLQGLAIGEALRPLAVAVPGGRTAAGLGQVAAAWEVRIAGTRWELRELGRALSAAADTYEAVEESARQSVVRFDGSSLRATGGPSGGPSGEGRR